jgi:segregation and condensation protein B
MSETEDMTTQPDAPPAPAAEVDAPSLETVPVEEAANVDLAELALQVEAALLATDRPLPAARLGEVLSHAGSKAVNAAVARLNELYQQTGRSFRIEQLAGGWQILTLPRFAPVLAALNKTRAQTRLTPAGLETLAIIAYKQPILRADIESIRGVACGEVLRSLMERRLVKIVGRAEVLGRPMLYGTTKSFLEVFGLASLKDLPKAEELKPKN